MSVYLHDINNVDIIQDIQAAIKGDRCILMAGSGLSAQASTKEGKNPPIWNKLLKDMIDWCYKQDKINEEDVPELYELVSEGFLIEAGQEIEGILSEKSLLQQCLRETLFCNDACISNAHNYIAKIPFRAYFTTNYDTLIESAISSNKGHSYQKYYEKTIDGVLESYRGNEKFILKLHGDVEDPNSIILGDRSYERLLYHNINYRYCLQTLFSMSSILFIGFGGSDPNLNGFLSNVAALDGRRSRHWMVVPEGMPKLKAKRLLFDKGIKVIQYKLDEKHSELMKFLELLMKQPDINLDGRKTSTTKIESESSCFTDLELEDS